jgi:hypothetical protein
MTICAAANIDDQGICLVADSIVTKAGSPVTSQVIVSKDGEVIEWEPEREGVTSKGETFQPVITDEFICYGEGVCKLARFGPDMFAAFSGNAGFCESLAEAMNLSAEKIEKEASVALNQPGWEETRGMIIPKVESYIKFCAEKVVATEEVSNGTTLEMLIAAKTVQNKPSLLKAYIRVRERMVEPRFLSIPTNQVAIIGSGANDLRDIDGQTPDPYYCLHPIPHALCMMSNWFSRAIRQRLYNRALGVGGAFMGAAISIVSGQSGFMPDLVEIVISPQKKVRVLTKTICRKPGFYVHDYMQARTGAYPILNYNSRYTVTDLFKLVPQIYESELRSLNAHCLIIENEAEDLGIPGHTVTAYDPNKFKQMIGWRPGDNGRSKLAIKLGEHWLTLDRQD